MKYESNQSIFHCFEKVNAILLGRALCPYGNYRIVSRYSFVKRQSAGSLIKPLPLINADFMASTSLEVRVTAEWFRMILKPFKALLNEMLAKECAIHIVNFLQFSLIYIHVNDQTENMANYYSYVIIHPQMPFNISIKGMNRLSAWNSSLRIYLIIKLFYN